MYARDVPAIREYAEANPENFADVVTFVLLSIRVQFSRVPAAMRDVRAQGRDSAFLWGWKQGGYDYIHMHKRFLHGGLVYERKDAVTTIDAIAQVPGLGIVKAAFVAQMLGHNVACFDSRNMDTLEWGGRPFRFDKAGMKPETRQRKIAEYVQMTIETGGAAHWWDHWCTGIAPGLGRTPSEVSRMHYAIVTGDRKDGYARVTGP